MVKMMPAPHAYDMGVVSIEKTKTAEEIAMDLYEGLGKQGWHVACRLGDTEEGHYQFLVQRLNVPVPQIPGKIAVPNSGLIKPPGT